MVKNSGADIINRDFSTGAKDPLTSGLLDTVAKRAPAHAEGQDNPQKEYIVDAPKKGNLGGIGQAGT